MEFEHQFLGYVIGHRYNRRDQRARTKRENGSRQAHKFVARMHGRQARSHADKTNRRGP